MSFPPSSPEGYKIEELMNIAKSEGLEAFVLQLPASKIRLQIQKGRPVICGIKKPITDNWLYHFPLEGGLLGKIIRWLSPDSNHFVVAIGFKDDQMLIMDPSIGLISLSEQKFESMHEKCNNVAILAAKKTNQ
jgi:predicted double-glycine peptidase